MHPEDLIPRYPWQDSNLANRFFHDIIKKQKQQKKSRGEAEKLHI